MHGKFYSMWEFEVKDQPRWLTKVQEVLQVLQQRKGFIEAHVMRSPDEPLRFAVHATWLDVGSYRRALGSTQAKLVVWPFLADMLERPSAFEEMIAVGKTDMTSFETSLDAD